jgi:hypothetical protein
MNLREKKKKEKKKDYKFTSQFARSHIIDHGLTNYAERGGGVVKPFGAGGWTMFGHAPSSGNQPCALTVHDGPI